MESMDKQICEFLAAGDSAESAAATCGVTLDYVKTLLKDANFLDLVRERGKEMQGVRVEAKYARTEEKILDRIQKEAASEFSEVSILVRALEVVAKNRVAYRNPASHLNPASPMNVTNVTLILPQAAAGSKVVLNGNSEIVAIGERTMASMPLDGVKDVFSKIERARKEVPNAESANQPIAIEQLPATAAA